MERDSFPTRGKHKRGKTAGRGKATATVGKTERKKKTPISTLKKHEKERRPIGKTNPEGDGAGGEKGEMSTVYSTKRLQGLGELGILVRRAMLNREKGGDSF